jgi:hypothetical protein
VSRETAIGLGATSLAVVAMAFDHLVDVDEGFPADPAAFAISVALILVVAGIVFGLVIPRTKRAAVPAEQAAKRSLVCGVLAVPSLVLVWLGVPFPVAGGAVALGLLGLEGERRRLALAGVALGGLVLALSVIGTDWKSWS